MSFKLPFNFQSVQDSLSYENLSKSLRKSKESIQPLADRTTQLITTQLHHLQELSKGTNVEVSELPEEYTILEKNCDLLFQLYSSLLEFTSETFEKVSYDYPPGNTALNKIKDSNVGEILSSKFNQLKNVSTPQELEEALMGEQPDEAHIQTISAQLPRTLYGKLAQTVMNFSEEFKEPNSPLSLALLQFSSAYMEIASARLDMDKKIVQEWHYKIVDILNEEFIKVNEMRKSVYTLRADFDTFRATVEGDEENEDLIKKEDEFVAATESAVAEMKTLLKPSKSIDLLVIFIEAQKEWHKMSLAKLDELSSNLQSIDTSEAQED